MTNFRYSQNPRVARKRPSRTSRVAARRRFSDNRYRERPEVHRSARRNKRANLTLTPSDITWVAREREPGFFWVEGTDSEGYHYGQGLVPASSAREAIEEMESGYQFSLRRGNRNRRANSGGYKSKLDLYFSAFNRAGQMVEITAKPDGDGYIWSYQGPDYSDHDLMYISLPFEEAYDLFLKEMDLTQGDFLGPELYTYTGNRRANRRRPHSTRHSANRNRAMRYR